MIRRASALCGALLLGLAAGHARADPISLDAWFQGPRLRDVSISPDGNLLALVVTDGDQGYVAIKDRNTSAPAKPVFATDPKQDIEPRLCGWTGEKRVVCRVSGMTGKRGAGKFVSRLVAFDADGANQRELLTSGPSFGPEKNLDGLRVSSWRTDEPETMLIQGWFPGSEGYAAGKLNSTTGILRIVAKPKNGVTTFQDDGFGNVLFAGGVPDVMSREKKVLLYSRKTNDDQWKPLDRLAAFASDSNIRLLKVIPGSFSAHAVMTHNGRSALFRVDLSDAKDPEPVYWHESSDIDGSISGARYKLLGVYFASSILGPQYLDERIAAIDKALQKKVAGRWNWVESISDDEKVIVIRTSSLSEPTSYYVLDTRQSPVRFDALGSLTPGLVKATLPITSGSVVRTREGRLKERIFTPAAGVAGKSPLVVFTDGTGRGGGFEQATYFLSTRGYAVLRPYFSGSDQDASWSYRPYLDWNGKLYDELLDSVRWAAQQPNVDPDRICIVGRDGYGGFQALLAAIHADNPFKCVASLEGLSDLAKPRRDVEKASVIGELSRSGPSDEQIAKESPLARAAELRIPVLLIEGDTSTHSVRDNRNGREMAAALAAAKKPHKLLLINEVDEKYTRAAYAELEKFLATHLAVD